MSIPAKHSRVKLIFAAVLASFGVRTAYLLILRPAIDSADSIHYIAMAEQFASGDFVSFDENLPVLYSLIAAAVHFLVRDWESAFWVVSLIASSLTVIPVVLLSRELHGDRAARIMAILIVFWPWLVDYATRIQPEPLSVLLWFTALWSVYRATLSGGAPVVIAPLVLFALHLARPEGILLMIAAPFGALMLCRGEGRPRLRRVLWMAAAIAVLIACYMMAMRLLIGTATVSYRAPMAGDWADYFRRGGVELGKTFLQVTFNALPVMLGPFLMLFMGLGVFSKPRDREGFGLEALVIFFCAVQYLATLANFSPAPRYIMPIIIACGLWSAWGLVRAREVLVASNWRRWSGAPAALTVGSFLLGLAAGFAAERFAEIPPTPLEYRAAGKWMRENVEPGLILTRKPQIGFYAGMPTTGPDASETVTSLVKRAEDSGARYVAIDARYTASLAPGIAGLLIPVDAPDTLRLLHEVDQWPEARVVIYEVVIPGMRYLPPEEFPRPDSHMGPDERRRKVQSEPAQ